MHYHLEIVMPPTDNVEGAVEEILAPFDENNEKSYMPFWDYWKIGGRWSGAKTTSAFSEERMTAFHSALHDAGVTVSGLRTGKPTLNPASQIPKVDEMWRQHFPESAIKECPLFDHYKGAWGDVMRLGDIPADLEASHVIVAALSYDRKVTEAVYMTQKDMYNGVSFIATTWSGKVADAISAHLDTIKGYPDDYLARATPTPDWLVVTVDYHS